MESLDPRIKRVENPSGDVRLSEKDCWGNYEVFHQKKSGEAFVHVGSLHAPNPELALVMAKEQYGRRLHTFNMWVVPSSAIFSFQTSDADMFSTTPEKLHREPIAYKVRDKIERFKKMTNE